MDKFLRSIGTQASKLGVFKLFKFVSKKLFLKTIMG